MKKIRISITVLILLTLPMLSYILTEVPDQTQVPVLAHIDNTQITTDPALQSSPAIYGDRIVWHDNRNYNYDIYMHDLSTGKETPITTDPATQMNPAIYGDRIVWQDYRNDNWDIYMLDLSTGKETPITTDPALQSSPAIYGDRIVWHDYRNDNYDIYMYDLSTGKETPITTDPVASQSSPAIYGDRIVWTDSRTGWDIYMHDLSTGMETRITTDFATQWNPAIYGDRIVWHDTRNWDIGNWDIYMHDLSTGKETPITTDPSRQTNPAIYGDRIVWEEWRNGIPDIYMYDLSTGKKTPITTDPATQMNPAIYGDRIVWQDYRNDNWDIYMHEVHELVHLIYGTNSGPVNLDPHYAWESSSIDVIDQVVETLYAYELLDPELALIPRLASDFGTWSIDGLNYTVPLRIGVTFHDGTPFNATAVKWNFDRLANFMNLENPTQISTLYLWFDDVIPIINKVEIVDEYTVKFVLNKPFAAFEALLCFSGSGIMSPASTPELSYIDTATGDLVGTGPFVYDNYEVDVKVTMHAYENYWKGAPYIDELTFSIILDIMGRNMALLDGTVDFLKTPQNSLLQLFRDDPAITLVDAGQDATMWFLGMNNRLIPVEMREAISYAIDYTYIIDELLGGEAVRLKSPIPLGIRYANWTFNVPLYDTVYARSVMQSMGFGVGWDTAYPGDDDDKWEDANFATYSYTYFIGSTLAGDVLVLLQDNLEKIGIIVVDDGIIWQEYFNRLSDHKEMLELFWLGWGPDYNDPSDFINELFSKDSVSNFAQVDDALVQN